MSRDQDDTLTVSVTGLQKFLARNTFLDDTLVTVRVGGKRYRAKWITASGSPINPEDGQSPLNTNSFEIEAGEELS